MKVVQINIVCGSGSTGKICVGISSCLNDCNIENYIIYNLGKTDYQNAIKCSEPFPKFQALCSRIKGNYGFNSKKTTNKLINVLECIDPDIVHLHNMHGHNCQLDYLLNYLKEKGKKVVWTFHDCWTFTAYCPHFTMVKCDKWKTECKSCPQYRNYSWFWDNSQRIYQKKKTAFDKLDLTIVTPSQWLKKQVQESFLNKYPIRVIHNGVDLNIFSPKESSFREKYNIPDYKYILLGVAIQWVPRKGVDVFIELAKRLNADKYQIVLVGTDAKIEKKLPENIIAIRKTNSQQELASIYSAADIFLNPTREEVFGLVNVEANACGTPVLTFDTGGSPECIDERSGMIVPCDDVESVYKEIIRICETNLFKKEDCEKRAYLFDEKRKYMEYVELYRELLNKK